MNVQAPNPFLRFWSLGYRRLVPIVPPGANISPKSALAKRPGSIGKAVGIQRRDGSWSGMDWIPFTATENDLRDWHAMGAGAGLKTGAGIVALDIDTLHQTVGDLVQALAAQMLGPAPLRWGREPKRLMLYRAPPETPYMRVIFDDGLPAKVGKEPRVELLTDQRQCVVHGVHPDTGRPYRWESLCPLEELTTVTAEQLRAFFARLAAELPAARVAVDEAATDRQHVNQEALRGRSDLVVEAVRRLPNTVDLFPTYDDYIRVGAAIKGALPDDPGLAEECFVEWAARFEGDDDFDPARAAADLRRVKPPFALGASWLYDQAERHGGASSFVAGTWFDAAAAPAAQAPLLFSIASGDETPTPAEPPLRAGRVSFDDLQDLPPREWLYGFKLSRRYVTFLASPGGVGKTAFTIAMALACAAGAGLLHDTPRKPLRVWLYNLEDDIVELRRRLAAAIRHFGLDPSVLDNIRLNSGRDRRFKIVKQDRDGGFIVTPDYAAVIAEMKREGIDILVVDPFLRSHGVSENENEAQDEVMRLYAQIAEETNAGIVLVHHTKKGAIAGDMDSLRGGSTQGGGARAAFTLSPMAAEEAERLGVPEDKRRLYVRLDDAKNNMAPPASRAEWLHLVSVGLNNGTPEYPAGDHVQVATAWEPPKAWEGVEGASEADALRLIEEGLPDGERYSARPQDTDRYAGTALVEKFGCTEGHAKATLANWTKQGLIELREYRSPTQRKDRKGLYVTRLGTLSGGSIFD